MTDETGTQPEDPKAPKKRPDKDVEALKEQIEAATKLAEAEGVTVGKGWTLDKIEAATLKAMQAKEDAAKAAAAEAAKPAPVAKPGPVEDPVARAEVMKSAHEAGMDLEDLKGRPLDVVLSMIGKHITEQAVKRTQGVQAEAGRVEVRVLKPGDNKISKGIHIPGVGDLCFKYNDRLPLTREAAKQLETRGFVEILE